VKYRDSGGLEGSEAQEPQEFRVVGSYVFRRVPEGGYSRWCSEGWSGMQVEGMVAKKVVLVP
jgi:hypothetical protein